MAVGGQGPNDPAYGPYWSYSTLAEQWNGTSWVTTATTDPAKPDFLAAVSCPSTGSCVADGSADEIWTGPTVKVPSSPLAMGLP
jgi:hypothetical protein